ncbi:MAG: hypothetical protein ACTS4V_00995 [Candidatus Hodgkinia cicadicola]
MVVSFNIRKFFAEAKTKKRNERERRSLNGGAAWRELSVRRLEPWKWERKRLWWWQPTVISSAAGTCSECKAEAALERKIA